MTPTLNKSDGSGFGSVINAAIEENSLGNIEVLHSMIAQFFNEWGEFQSTNSDERALDEWITTVCGYLADVLLGDHPESYKPLPTWNHSDNGGVAHFIEVNIGIEGDTPKEIMTNYFITRLTALVNLVNQTNEHRENSAFGGKLNSLVSQTAYQLLGIHTPAL